MPRWIALTLCLLLGCSDPEPLDLPEGCQPLLAGYDCLLPFPSNYFLKDGRVEITGAATLLTLNKESAVPTDVPRRDGFSPFGVIVTVFEQAVDPVDLPSIRSNPPDSVLLSSPSLILDTQTNTFIPHFVDLDPRASDDTRRALVLHPLQALDWQRRYIVALKDLNGKSGPIPAPEGFARLREDPSDPFHREVITPLENAGIDIDRLQLAFTFTTASKASTHADVLAMRDLTLDWLDNNRIEARVTELDEPIDPGVWRRIEGEMTVPYFLDGTRRDALLARDGHPVLKGTDQVRFTVLIPDTVRDRFSAGRPFMHGHGFFGSRADVDRPRMVQIANQTESVLFSMDWRGLSTPDIAVLSDVLTNRPKEIPGLSDRLAQAIMERLVFTRAIQSTLAELDALHRPQSGPGVVTSSTGSNAGQLVYDPSEVYFLGTSAGSIHGTTLAAISPDLHRVVLNVGGGSYTQMMFRAQPFAALLLFLGDAIPDALEQQKFAVLQQGHFDRIDSISWAADLRERDVDVLLQAGVGDIWVPNLGTMLVARAMQLPLLQPSPIEAWGLDTVSPPQSSALTLYDFGIDPAVYDLPNLDQPPNEVHTGVLELDAAIRQIDAFLAPNGQIIHPCDGVCDPE